jgi:hypothetical protein
MSGRRAQVASDEGHQFLETHDGVRIVVARVLLIAILCGILVAGLWPFCAPANQVRWSTEGNGIELGRHGTGVSLGMFKLSAGQNESAGSVETLLVPHRMPQWKTILAFDTQEHPGGPFRVVQREDALVVERHNVDPQGICRTSQFAVRNVFESGRRVHVTIVLSAHHTLVYVNGALAVDSYLAGDSSHNLTGRLVLANSTDVDNSWSGKVLGLAIYSERLSTNQVARDFTESSSGAGPRNAADETALAVYRFDEHQGRVAHNASDGATDLVFPKRYFVLHPRFLTPPWASFRFGWPEAGYWQDVVINILGFVPVGFLVLNYISVAHKIRHGWILTIIAGFLLSLTIEVLQWFLPTRDSGMTDLITNTLGTALGAAVYRVPGACGAWNRLCELLTPAWLHSHPAELKKLAG